MSSSYEIISDVQSFITKFLNPCLPYSLPLLRRCQFHEKHKHTTPHAQIWLAGTTIADSVNRKWLAAHIDLTNPGQTQVWTFASWENGFADEENPAHAIRASPQFGLFKELFDRLFLYLKHDLIPQLDPSPPPGWLRLKAEGKILSEPFSTSKVLFGTIAESLWPFLAAHKVSREDRPYLKYIVASRRGATGPEAPVGLHFASMDERHLQTIIDRTNIPRTLETLRQLPSIGLYTVEGVPVAWGLLGKDSSLSSLHTEPEYRRKGLAVLVAKRLLVEQAKFFHEEDTDQESGGVPSVYSHADVSDKNIASRKVMEKLGGEVMWRVAWIEIDLNEDIDLR